MYIFDNRPMEISNGETVVFFFHLDVEIFHNKLLQKYHRLDKCFRSKVW